MRLSALDDRRSRKCDEGDHQHDKRAARPRELDHRSSPPRLPDQYDDADWRAAHGGHLAARILAEREPPVTVHLVEHQRLDLPPAVDLSAGACDQIPFLGDGNRQRNHQLLELREIAL